MLSIFISKGYGQTKWKYFFWEKLKVGSNDKNWKTTLILRIAEKQKEWKSMKTNIFLKVWYYPLLFHIFFLYKRFYKILFKDKDFANHYTGSLLFKYDSHKLDAGFSNTDQYHMTVL